MSTYRSSFSNRPFKIGHYLDMMMKEIKSKNTEEEMENVHKIKGLCMKGMLIKKEEVKTGTSARGEWKMQNFVVEEYGSAENQYPQKIAFSCSGNVVDQLATIAERTDVVVLFDLRGREYNERYYNELRAWSVKPANETAAPAPTAPAAAPAPTTEGTDDLPW